ncbi:TlpA family protein disulfide reductase [Winogradskyella luteola]|uniref:TlpA family protein disulfide reductase n=1 Tax=Winogradskyella luteola TaxID=2828330 RepID=A0A9X1F7J9_9FLAO|nr:TlpA disulfide reductase family protein [Winogradskyella luteola]MBV7268815.1 TlpA family protein disulfide reductase [Winogradskyella luteola]
MKTTLLLILIFCSSLVLGQENILQASGKVCKNLSSIEYEISQKPEKGKYGFPTIKANITQQKADVKDIGFGKALIKVKGTIEEKGVSEPFSFSYDGSQFLFQRGESKVKRYTKPTRGIVMGLLQQYLFMLHIRPFSEETPYKPLSNIFHKFQHVGEDVINEKKYQIIKSVSGILMPTNKNGKSLQTKNKKPIQAVHIFWIDSESKLPIFYTDKFNHKTISIKKLNKNYQKSYFTLINKNTSVQERSYQETQQDISGENLLKVNSLAPKWSGVSQNGEKFSSEQLKEKVVLIDFWGTWCPPCIIAMPMIERLEQLYKNNKDVVIIGVSAGEKKPQAAENYFKNKGYSYIHIPNGDDIAEIFKIKSYPTMYIIDKSGIIVQSTSGFDSNDFEQSKIVINKHMK